LESTAQSRNPPVRPTTKPGPHLTCFCLRETPEYLTARMRALAAAAATAVAAPTPARLRHRFPLAPRPGKPAPSPDSSPTHPRPPAAPSAEREDFRVARFTVCRWVYGAFGLDGAGLIGASKCLYALLFSANWGSYSAHRPGPGFRRPLRFFPSNFRWKIKEMGVITHVA
jgi:hypothetical protein